VKRVPDSRWNGDEDVCYIGNDYRGSDEGRRDENAEWYAGNNDCGGNEYRRKPPGATVSSLGGEKVNAISLL
jgi:hypothetical protein